MSRRDLGDVLDRWGRVPIALGVFLYLYNAMNGSLVVAAVDLAVYTGVVSFLIFHRDRLHRGG